MQQPSLWDDTPDTPPQLDILVPPIGGTLELPTCWADGDRRPEQLARLAHVLIGNTDIFRASDGSVIWFRIIDTRVEGDHVIMTLKRIPRIGKGYVDWQRERGEVASDEE